MELGEKLRRARIEAGLSQRQLCGGEITRNMLSQIEHGTAKPSMRTLQYLAGQLGKSVSFFLEEGAAASPNQQAMESARQRYDAGDWAGVVEALGAYRGPDRVHDRERALLWVLAHLALAERALEEGREPYARELLEKADVPTAYCGEDLSRRRLLLLGRVRGQQVCGRLPSLDGELLLRAEESLRAGDLARSAHLLEAMEDHSIPRWQLLRGQLYLASGDYASAARCFHGAEAAYPRETAPRLEQCYRELQDYRRAYEYACMQRGR